MERVKKENIKTVLAEQIKEYVKIILKEYGKYIPCEKLIYLKNIEDLKDKIHIEKTGTISLFVRDGEFYFPEHVEEILNKLKFVPGFGRDKNHKCYNKDNLIENDNTYLDYMKHMHKIGITSEEFYLETLLHETLHFCGAGGFSPLLEGINELTTRKLAKKYNLTTSACGYPKEIKIVCELEKILGEEMINKILFTRGSKVDMEIQEKYGFEIYNLFRNIHLEMNKEFYPKYYDKSFPGLLGPLKKTKAYSKINYEKVYQLLKDYKTKQIKKESISNKKQPLTKHTNRKTVIDIYNANEQEMLKEKNKSK